MKNLITLVLLLSLISLSLSKNTEKKDFRYLICYIGDQEDITECLYDMNSSTQGLQLIQKKGTVPDISGIGRLVQTQLQLEAVEISFYQVVDPQPLYNMFSDYNQITDIKLNFKGFQQFDQFQLPGMIESQYKTLNNLILNFDKCTTDLAPFAEIFAGTLFVQSIDLTLSPNKDNEYGIKNLQYFDGLFQNCFSLETIVLTIYNSQWTEQDLNSFGQIFKGTYKINDLYLSLKNNDIQDINFLTYAFQSLSRNLEILTMDIRIPLNSFEPLRLAFNSMNSLSEVNVQTGYLSKKNQEEYIPTKEYFESLESLFSGIQYLKQLDFTMDKINTQNFEFSQFKNTFNAPKLENLYISLKENEIESLENIKTMFEGLEKIKYIKLDLSSNLIDGSQLKYFKNALESKNSLKTIVFYFTNNKIEHLNEFYTLNIHLPRYVTMVFENNNISSLEGLDGFFDNMESLFGIHLDFNQNNVSDLQPLIKYLQKCSPRNAVFDFDQNCLKESSRYYQDIAKEEIFNLQECRVSVEDQQTICGKFEQNQ